MTNNEELRAYMKSLKPGDSVTLRSYASTHVRTVLSVTPTLVRIGPWEFYKKDRRQRGGSRYDPKRVITPAEAQRIEEAKPAELRAETRPAPADVSGERRER